MLYVRTCTFRCFVTRVPHIRTCTVHFKTVVGEKVKPCTRGSGAFSDKKGSLNLKGGFHVTNAILTFHGGQELTWEGGNAPSPS